MTPLGLALAVVYGLLAAVHVVWAARGVSSRSVAIPEVSGRPAFVPSRAATSAVAAALAAAACVVLAADGLIAAPVPRVWVRGACSLLGAVFVARAIGEFRLVGFFKTVRGTAFARWDSLLFSPLCLALGAGTLALAGLRP